jgi:hypothetical protein
MKLAPAVAIALSAVVQTQAGVSLETVLQRMRAYLTNYANTLPAVIATEKYDQRAGSGARRKPRHLESDYGLIQLKGYPGWLGFREVLAVDGKPVPDSARRLADLFAKPSEAAVKQARRIAEESSRYNIGPVVRTINDPVVILEILDARNSQSLQFSKAGEATIGGTRVWVLAIKETGRPTVIRTSDLKDLPLRGRAWVDPETGRVARGEVAVEPAPGVTATVEVSFEHDRRLGFAVPSRMIERYTNRNLVTVSSGEATYSNYRQFSVETRENLPEN